MSNYLDDKPTSEVSLQPETTADKQSPAHWLPPEDWKAANQIADQLKETKKQARHQIVTIIKRMGLEFAQSILQETLAAEAQGGLMLPDGSRRRTIGGVFFYLVRERVPANIRAQLFRPYWKKKQTTPASEQSAVFAWDERETLLSAVLQEPGTATKVNTVLIGSPTNIQAQPGYVVFKLTPTGKTATPPKGVPRQALPPTQYTVYVASKQWKHMEEAAADPEDSLIIEGTCAYNAQIGGMAFYVTNITSKGLEAKKREQKGRV